MPIAVSKFGTPDDSGTEISGIVSTVIENASLLSTMMRFTWFSVLLALLTVGSFQALPAFNAPAVAQTSTCTPDQTLEIRESNLRDQARAALDNGDVASAVRTLQETLVLTPRTQYPHNTIEQWLLEDNNGTRVARLIKVADRQQTIQILNQLFQITQRLSPNYSSIKTRALAAIAVHSIILNQLPTASTALSQARESVRFVKGATEKADSLLDIAAGYVAMPQPQMAQSTLTQAEKAVQQVPQSDRLARFVRLAKLYAQAENYPQARAIVMRIPTNLELRSVALREIAEAYLEQKNLQDADRVIQSIPHPTQKAIALRKLAVAYQLANQPSIATQRFQDAIRIAKAPNLESAFVSSEMLLRDIMINLAEVGRRNEARQLLSTSGMKNFRSEAYKAIILADLQANQPRDAQSMLSQHLTEIQNQQDSWQSFELANLIQTAIEVEQFDWFAQEWDRISKLGYASSDESVERIAKTYAQKGRHIQALQWAEKLSIADRPLLQIRLKSTIALVAHQSGQTAWAKNLLQTTEQQIDSLSQAARDRLEREGGDVNEPDDIEYIGVGLVALSYAQMGESATTKKLLDRVIQSKANQSDLQLGGRVDNPFDLFQSANQLAGALQLANGSVMPEKRQQRLQAVLSMALAQNRFDIATSIVSRLTGAANQTMGLLAIAQRYMEVNQARQALPFLAQAFKVAQTIPGDESQFDHLGADGGTVIEMDNDRGSLLEAIAVQYARLQQPAQAMKVANTLKEKKTRDQALEKVRCAERYPM